MSVLNRCALEEEITNICSNICCGACDVNMEWSNDRYRLDIKSIVRNTLCDVFLSRRRSSVINIRTYFMNENEKSYGTCSTGAVTYHDFS